jgi:hypothetical protein
MRNQTVLAKYGLPWTSIASGAETRSVPSQLEMWSTNSAESKQVIPGSTVMAVARFWRAGAGRAAACVWAARGANQSAAASVKSRRNAIARMGDGTKAKPAKDFHLAGIDAR